MFIVTGGYPELKCALRERGWVQNPDKNSPCFDLKYTLQGRELDYDHLLDFQMVNHFQKNGVITTKLGLTRSLRNSMWTNDLSQDAFYPKCYDLNDEADAAAFDIEFKICKALSILKIYAHSTKGRRERGSQNPSLIEELKRRTEVAVTVCLKNIEDVDDLIDKKKAAKVVTEKEWDILGSDELNQDTLAKKKHEDWLKSIDCKFNGRLANRNPQDVSDNKKKKKKKKK